MNKLSKCKHCGSDFERLFSRSLYCSWMCRFKSNYPLSKDNGACWDWPMSRNAKTGYGQFNKGDGKPSYAHRLAYEISSGVELDASVFVMHTCDRPCCFNPAHLVAGTRIDNIKDMVKKDRNKFGVSHHNAKLNPEKVLYIRASKKTQRDLAIELGVSAGVISQVLRGLIWRRV